MKVLNKIVIGMASLVLLTACGPSKCSFEKYKEQANAASEKDPGYKKVVVKGSVKATVVGITAEVKMDHTFEKDGDEWKMTKGEEGAGSAAALLAASARAWDHAVQENENATYYAGNGFKVEIKGDEQNATYVYNSYGYMTSSKASGDSEGSVKLTWSK